MQAIGYTLANNRHAIASVIFHDCCGNDSGGEGVPTSQKVYPSRHIVWQLPQQFASLSNVTAHVEAKIQNKVATVMRCELPACVLCESLDHVAAEITVDAELEVCRVR